MKNNQILLIIFVLFLIYIGSNSLKIKIDKITWIESTSYIFNTVPITVYFPNTMNSDMIDDVFYRLPTLHPIAGDIFVINTMGVYWFALASANNSRNTKTGGGLLAGIWELVKSNEENNYNIKQNGELLSPYLGTYLYGNYNITNNSNYTSMYWGLEQVVDAKTTLNSGKSILSLNSDGDYSDNGIFIEFTGTITNQINSTQNGQKLNAWQYTVDNFTSSSDTDPSKTVGITSYTLTYRIPADKGELKMIFSINPLNGVFPISQIDFKVNLNAKTTDSSNNNVNYEVISSPELMITNNTTSLAQLSFNKYFTNKKIKMLYDYTFSDLVNPFGVKTPPGRGQVICAGAPLNNISFLCFYPNNNFLPAESIEDYSLSLTETKMNALAPRKLVMDYTLLNGSSIQLSSNQAAVVSMRIKFLDVTQVLSKYLFMHLKEII